MARNNFPSQNSSDDLFPIISLFRSFLRLHDSVSNSPPRDKKTLNLLLLGKTGHGKSATGNSTLGRKDFVSKSSASSVTSEIKSGQVECENYILNIIDSPGLADTNYEDNRLQELLKAIENFQKAISMCAEGIHSFLFVLKFGNRFTAEEQTTLEWLRGIFGPDFLEKWGIIVFTHGDLFEDAMEDDDTPEKDFDEWCSQQEGPLGDLIQECENRCVLFNNREKNEKKRKMQMEQLIDYMEDFNEPYDYSDFCEFEQSRERLILELKVPQLKERFKLKINNLKSELTIATSQQFKQLVDNLEMEIRAEDKGTGLLCELHDELSHVRLEARRQKIRQDEARRIQDEARRIQDEARRMQEQNENSCSIQ